MRAKAYRNTVRMMTQGRNYGIRFACITQFASLIDKNAMRYMRQRYIGYTDEPNDLEYILRFFPKRFREQVEKMLRKLEAGQFIYKCGDKINQIKIEPFTSSTKPQKIETPDPPIAEDTPQTKHGNNGKAIATIITAMLFFLAIIIGFGNRPSG